MATLAPGCQRSSDFQRDIRVPICQAFYLLTYLFKIQLKKPTYKAELKWGS